MNTNEGIWLSIDEYARSKKISISTIRRRIKTDSVKFKLTHGKYFIFFSSEEEIEDKMEKKLLELTLENEALKFNLRKLNEENHELKMLIQIYEKTGAKSVNGEMPPEVPRNL